MKSAFSVAANLVDAKTGRQNLPVDEEAGLYTFLHLVAAELQPQPRDLNHYFDALLHYNLARAYAGGRLIGLASWAHHETPPRPELRHLGPVSLIDTIVVDPEFRRRDVARAMHDTIVKARKWTTPVTRAWSSDSTSLAFLHRLGYRNAVTVPDPTGLGNDGLYLTR